MGYSFNMKTFSILLAMFLPVLSLTAQPKLTATGEIHQLGAPLPTTDMSHLIKRADGTSQSYAPDYYWFMCSSNANMSNASIIGQPVQIATATMTNGGVLSMEFNQPYGTKVYFATISSNSVLGEISTYSAITNIVTQPPPIVFVRPLGPPPATWTY
jgi:hypothetical protein